MSMSTPQPLDYVSQLQRQIEEEVNSISPWQYEKIIDQWCEASQFVYVSNAPFDDCEVFHADFAHTNLDGGSV